MSGAHDFASGVRLLALKRQHRFIPGEEQHVSAGAGQELYARIGLPVICLEAQRQLAVAVENLGLSFWVGLGRADCRRNSRRLIDKRHRI